LLHSLKIGAPGQQGNVVSEGVGGDEQIEGLDDLTSAGERCPKLTRLLPEVPRLGQQFAGVEQVENPSAACVPV
jgi:hypothetical protein